MIYSCCGVELMLDAGCWWPAAGKRTEFDAFNGVFMACPSENKITIRSWR